MPEIEPLIPGIYARSETLVQTTRDHDRDRVDDATLREHQRRDAEDLIGVQVAAGFDTISPGLLTWQDIFRPFTAFVPGLAPETLTRFVDTNTFYRRPDLEGQVEIDRTGLSSFATEHVPELTTVDGVATVPAPTAWVSACRDEEGAFPDADRATAFAETVYPPLIDAIAERGYTTVTLTDPWLARYPEPEHLLASLDTLGQATDDIELLLQLPFQDATPVLDAVAGIDVDGVVVDRTETPHEALGTLPGDVAVGLGLVDARSSLVEREDLLLGSLSRAVDDLDTDTVYLTPNGDLQHVPERIARRKTRVLGEVAGTARTKLGGDAR